MILMVAAAVTCALLGYVATVTGGHCAARSDVKNWESIFYVSVGLVFLTASLVMTYIIGQHQVIHDIIQRGPVG